MEKQHIAILGSTGSIGTQALEVIIDHPDYFSVELLSAFTNASLLIEQARKYKPNIVVIADENQYETVFEVLDPLGIKVYTTHSALEQVVALDSIDIVLAAIVGYAGLKPTISAINAGKHIALANKETLVVAGEIITKLAKEKGVNIYPVDSEHSAIFQCLAGEFHNKIEKIYLTASGGPFRGKDSSFLQNVTKEQALVHPNWNMGAKITIDSATLMNKGLEMIEAKWLFNVAPSQIETIIHPQSIIHSIVEFEDGSMKAQMGLPDMRLPIQYAFGYPNRYKSEYKKFSFLDYPKLTFEQPDFKTFRNLALSYEAINKGGNMPCIMNAANEVVVSAFLEDRVPFLKMADLIETCMQEIDFIAHPELEDLEKTDLVTREFANSIINQTA